MLANTNTLVASEQNDEKPMTKPIEKIAFELWAGVGSRSDLEEWAETELRKVEPHLDACEMFNLSKDKAKEQSLRLALEISNFHPVSEQGEKWAQELLNLHCAKFLNKEIQPLEFCKLVNLFDSAFLGLHTLENGTVYYPDWLGKLWNECDWCNDAWTIDNSPQLAAEVKKFSIAQTPILK